MFVSTNFLTYDFSARNALDEFGEYVLTLKYGELGTLLKYKAS